VTAHLSNTAQTEEVRHDANTSDEDLLVLTEIFGPLINDGSDETFDGTELRVKTQHDEHEEEKCGPER